VIPVRSVIATRIPTKALADLSRRMATSLSAGIEVRKAWNDEIGRTNPRYRPAIAEISDRVARGNTFSQALERTGDAFPPLFRELVSLGDATGRLPDILRRLAEQYEHQLELKRSFRAALRWPLIQLCAAIAIVGFLIWITGIFGNSANGEPYDPLGFGLQGTSGLLIYMAIVAALVGCGYGIYKFISSDTVRSGKVQQWLLEAPVVGDCLQAILLSRFAWALGLSLEAGLDVRRALPFAFRGTGSDVFQQHALQAEDIVGRGQTVSEALAATCQFPPEFLATVDVGEQAGTLAESLLHEADQLQEQAREGVKRLSVIGITIIWIGIAALIIAIIFRMALQYIDLINSLM